MAMATARQGWDTRCPRAEQHAGHRNDAGDGMKCLRPNGSRFKENESDGVSGADDDE